MTRRIRPAPHARLAAGLLLGASLAGTAFAAEPKFPITTQQRSTAQKVAEAGVPLSELA